jgi:hypothetical protein
MGATVRNPSQLLDANLDQPSRGRHLAVRAMTMAPEFKVAARAAHHQSGDSATRSANWTRLRTQNAHYVSTLISAMTLSPDVSSIV